jgi:uncharacterized protein
LVVTGSNAKLLSSELATALTGRHLAVELLPFSYGEYLKAVQQQRCWQSFETYLRVGGFPEVVLSLLPDPRIYLQTLFDSVVLKDLVRRKKIRNPQYLTNTLALLVSNVSCRTSARALSKAQQKTPAPPTVEKYLAYLEEAYLVETTRCYRPKTKERLQSDRKPYLLDTGLIEAVSQPVLPLHGKQLENAVYLELRRRGYSADSTLFYYRAPDGKEVDFLLRGGAVTSHLIQVCLDAAPIETREREMSALSAGKKEHPQAELLIVTANESGTAVTDSGDAVRIIPAYEYCR